MNTLQNTSIEQVDQNIHKIIFEGGQVLYLIGTAHVSAESVKLVEDTIYSIKPDTVALELDPHRLEVLKNKKRYQETDIIEIFKKGKALFFTAQMLLTSYQKKISKKTGVEPGAEFKKAIECAEEIDARIITADRNIGITLKRAFRKMSFMEKLKMFSSLLFSSDNDVSEEQIEELKKSDALTQIIGEMGESLPTVKQVILDERDTYLAGNIMHNLGNVTVAVVGAAHVPGILEKIKETISQDHLREIEEVPPPSKMTKTIPWFIPVIILSLFVYGFFTGDSSVTGQALIYWVLINGVLSALGCMLALAHPLTIVIGFVAAPITSLNPTIGAGIVTGLAQLYLVRPRIKDIEKSADDAGKLKSWWKNRLLRTLLVSIFSSIGSSIGTFVAFPLITKMLLS